jgi:hypothetical protein
MGEKDKSTPKEANSPKKSRVISYSLCYEPSKVKINRLLLLITFLNWQKAEG